MYGWRLLLSPLCYQQILNKSYCLIWISDHRSPLAGGQAWVPLEAYGAASEEVLGTRDKMVLQPGALAEDIPFSMPP